MGSKERVFTVEEANDLVPKLEVLVDRAREAVEAFNFASGQVQDLRRMHGKDVEDPEHSEHGTFQRHSEEARERRREVDEVRRACRQLGVELKDPILGLVDLPAERGDGEEVVYLCWKQGEAEVQAWHPRDEGFQGRRPVEEL